MKRILLSLLVGALSLSFVAVEVQAKRLGGGSSSGMKRATPPPAQAPAKPAAAAPATAAAAAPATPPKRSWMGPLAGVAAGLGIAALMSHMGLGGALGGIGSMISMLLMAVAAFFVLRFLFQRFGPKAANANMAPQGMQFAGAGAAGATGFFGSGSGSGAAASSAPTAVEPSMAAPVAALALPAGFDVPSFERAAKLIFIRMQAANDSADLNDLRQFSTPEMFAGFRLELQDRKGAAQQTDVVQLDAQVLDFAQEAGSQIVSVRFHGLIREEKDAPTAIFDEVWHLTKPLDGSREWAIAGIAQSAVV